MTRPSRFSETYRRRLRLSSRDVAVAVVVTLLAGAVIATAFWKAPPASHTARSVQIESEPEHPE